MPVKGVFEVFKQKLDDFEKFVNIKKAIQSRKNDTLIVISLKNLKALKKERQYFGRFQVEEQRFDKFFKDLHDTGARLVFFCEGPDNAGDLKEQIRKKRQKSNRAKTVIAESRDTLKVFANIGFSTYWLEDIAKKYGQVRMGKEECYYRELASFATNNRAFSVIAHNSDLLVYPGRWRYWNASELNMERMTTQEYRKFDFYKDFNMNNGQMALFATLLGNRNYFPEDNLSNFKQKENVNELVAYVKRFQACPLQENEINQILLDVRGGENWKSNIEYNSLKNKFKKSLQMYSLIRKEKFVDKIEYSLLSRKAFVALHLLNRMPIWKTIFYYDPQEIDPITMIKEILQKFAGVIHFYTQSYKGPNSQVYFFEAMEPVECKPVYPKNLEVPRLIDLYKEQAENFEDRKYKLLIWIIAEALDFEVVKNFNKKFLCAALTLYKLLTSGVITSNESDLVMLTIKRAENGSINKVEVKGKVNKRAVEIACIFGRLFYFIRDIIKTLAMDDIEVLPKFDSYHFNELYIKMDAMTFEEKTDLLKDAKIMQISDILS